MENPVPDRLPLTGVVLAGGRSRRMGDDKAFVQLRGTPLIHWVLGALRSVCSEVMIVADTAARFSQLGIHVVEDLRRDEGPLIGVLTGLSIAQTDWVFVSSCDAPFLHPDMVRSLWELREGFDLIVPTTNEAPNLKPLCALYATECVEPIRALLDRGERRLSSLLPVVRTRVVAEQELRPHDSQLLSFLNVNTPEDLRRAEEIAAGPEGRSRFRT